MRLQDLSDEQLSQYADLAIAHGKTNHALNALNHLVRRQPDQPAFLKLADLYQQLKRPAIEALYTQAALQKAPPSQRKTLEARRDACLERFLRSNPKVVKARAQLAKTPYSKDILAERKKFQALAQRGDTDAAFALGMRQHEAGKVDPLIQGIWCSLAMRRGHHQMALTAAFVAFVVSPADWIVLTNIADILIQLRRATQALDYALASVNLRPQSATGWLNLGATWELLGKTWESINATRKAIEINPKDPGSWTNLGNAHKNSGHLVDALPAYREALRLNPENPALWSNLLFGINYDPQASAEQIAKEHLAFGRHIESRVAPTDHSERLKGRIPQRIRVGFVSADVRAHPVAYFLEPLWSNIDRGRFEIFSYDNFPSEDAVTKRFKAYADRWLNISGMTDDAVTRQILDDKIDVLVDMSGHTARNRLSVFARKPAPVQVTWLGHPNTTGMSRMDWRITDAGCDPEGVDPLYSEKLWRLPIHAAYAPLIKQPELRADPAYAVSPTPALNNGYITFGTCNNLAKLSPGVVRLWGSVLQQIPTSKLLIEAPGLAQPEYRQSVQERFTAVGIEPERLVLHDRISAMQYRRYHEIDIALDPFPYGGGTTTCDLLWMGVPLVTLAGDRPMARIGSAFLRAVGHPEWIATTEGDYLAKVLALAGDIPRLAQIRSQLRAQTQASRVMDGPAYARSFERALDAMVKQAYGQSVEPAQVETSYEDALRWGNQLLASRAWQQAYEVFDGLRNEFGAEPNALFGAGLACAQMGDHQRASRYMADALLRRLEPQWVPWLAASYEKLNYALPMYVLAFWMQRRHPEMGGTAHLFPRARALLAQEMVKRGLLFPQVPKGEVPEAATQANAAIVQLLKAEKNEQALALAEQALGQYPTAQPLLLNAALAAKRLQQFQKAGICCLMSLAIDPLGFGAIINFGNLLVAANSPQDSMLLLEAGAIVTREDAILWSNLAVAYNSMRVAPWEAEFAARRALGMNGRVATTWSALGKSLSRQGRMAEALEALNRAREIDPRKKNDDLFTLQYAEELSIAEIAQAHFEAGQEMVRAAAGKGRPLTNDLRTDRPLKIGFVTGDLVAHPVAYFMREVFLHLDQTRYPVTVYFTKLVAQEDTVSAFFKAHSQHWINVSELDDDTLAQRIRDDKIDILIDLSGHTAHNRLPVFAQKPAPVQVTYLGHPNTSGLPTMDWRLVDRFTGPASIEPYYTEKLWRMPDAHCVYTPLVRQPELRDDPAYAVQPTPALVNGYVTFGCCNNLAKISPSVVALWSRILLGVPDSRLLIEAPGLHQREFKRSLTARFEKHGVQADRLILLDRDTKQQYKIYNRIDIALDPFPYNGGTTSCDLLWFGVPMVTLPGQAEVSRLGLTFVNTIGHPEWAATGPDEYLRIAIDLAAHHEELNKLRQSVRDSMQSSALMDGKRFTRNLEQAFSQMWGEYFKDIDIRAKASSK
jgi:predicted O-linked N-acetylglucosamine transferase (SPINDLY family)